MITSKEALELKGCPFCGGEPIYPDYDAGDTDFVVVCRGCGASSRFSDKQRDVITAWNTRANASIQGEDAVERVAQTIREYCIGVSPASIQLSHGVERIYYAGLSVLELARAVLATGLVPDEASVRADEREKVKDLACESLLVMSDGYLNDPDDHDVSIAFSNAAVFMFGKERAQRIRAAIRSGDAQ